jgi:hypothetical protein
MIRNVITLSAVVLALGSAAPARSQARFADDFESGLGKWELVGEGGAFIRESADPAHGRVLVLRPEGDVLALVPHSEQWGAVRVEGDVLFPDESDGYLGVVYDCRSADDRRDFGVIHIKGSDSYLMANPHRDFNVGRALYPEYQVPLEGESAVRPGKWQHFRVEVVGGACHFYLGDTNTPQMTFGLFDLDSGAVGLTPRSVGGDVWVDNVTVTSIRGFSYEGPPRPDGLQYDPEALLTDWRVAGPLEQTDDAIARHPDMDRIDWRPFATDARGAVVTGRVVDYHGPRTVAYFWTQVVTDEPGDAFLDLSTVDDLAIWVNGRFHAFVPRGERAWYDFWRNPKHEGKRVPLELVPGKNDIIVRVRGGVYASGGFFSRLEHKH